MLNLLGKGIQEIDRNQKVPDKVSVSKRRDLSGYLETRMISNFTGRRYFGKQYPEITQTYPGPYIFLFWFVFTLTDL